ncbi:MAG: hypothetical protein VX672_07165 [Planctomycetota bacterium]|nr:hypothetical protein [Planctomycetota bacterium]
MSTLSRIIAAIVVFSGWIVALIQIHQDHARRVVERNGFEDRLELREKPIRSVPDRRQKFHRPLVRGLEQAEISFDLERELANRRFDAAGDKPATRKFDTRAAVTERRDTGVPLIGRVTPPNRIGKLHQRAQETTIEITKPDWQHDPEVDRGRSAPSLHHPSPAAA